MWRNQRPCTCCWERETAQLLRSSVTIPGHLHVESLCAPVRPLLGDKPRRPEDGMDTNPPTRVPTAAQESEGESNTNVYQPENG